MTAPVRNALECPECGAAVPYQTPFSDWLRGLAKPLDSTRISNHNLDYIWHNYKEHWLLTIEEKRHEAECSFSQQSTHGVVSQLLETASGAVIKTASGSFARYIYKGHYVIQFERTTPDDGWLKINGQAAPQAVLLGLLHTGQLAPVDSIRRFKTGAPAGGMDTQRRDPITGNGDSPAPDTPIANSEAGT